MSLAFTSAAASAAASRRAPVPSSTSSAGPTTGTGTSAPAPGGPHRKRLPLGTSTGLPRDLTDDQKREVREAFDLFDGDRDNRLDAHETKVAFRALGFDVKKAEVAKLMAVSARNGGNGGQSGSGCVEYEDFERSVTEKILARDPLDELRKAFALFDTDRRGAISVRDLRRVAMEVGEHLDEDEVKAMVDEFDVDGDGEINEQEFIAIMTDDF
ncbi:hypothetical protein BC828DRAFT_374531 [Blastocladiella britannica]|nr:hypothetical protein BC828DRAFT_374531 [Blastocladiella britannica]